MTAQKLCHECSRFSSLWVALYSNSLMISYPRTLVGSEDINPYRQLFRGERGGKSSILVSH